MGRRGPPPQPTNLRVLNGNPSKRPLPANEPRPKPIAPKCPSWLDKEAKAEWKRIAPELDRLGLLTQIDASAMAAYCQAYSRWKQAEIALNKHGTVFKTPNGYIQQLPQVAIAQKYSKIMREFCQEFGLTPASRTRINTQKLGEEDDPMEQLLRNRGG